MSGEPTTPQAAIDLDRDHALHLLHEMVRIRRFEAKCAESMAR
jgi:TPP-dependent pyruvate/acetoin dehydrogenase alpha subunit